MSSQLPKTASDESSSSERRTWSMPAFSRLETGDAEGNDGVATDAGQIS